MKIINPVAQRKLGERQSEANPVSRDVRYVIEEDSAYRQISKFLESGGMGDSVEDRASTFGLESKRNKSREATGLILKFSQATQMIDSVMGGLDVAIQHRTGAVPAHLVPGAVHLGPLLGALLAPANLITNLRIKDFGSASRNGAETVLPKELKRFTNRTLKTRSERWRISMAVNALMISFSSSTRKLRNSSRYHSPFKVG